LPERTSEIPGREGINCGKIHGMRLKSGRIAALAGILGFACLVPLSADQGSERRPMAGAGSRVMPFRLYANAIWFNVRVGKSRPLAFQLDTAAGASVLNRSTADEIGLQFIGEASQANAGSGDNETRIALYPGVSLKLDDERSLWAVRGEATSEP